MNKYHFDVLVIGSGLAGLYAALSSAEWGKVAIVTKSTLKESNTYWAQGGVAAALHKDDSPDFHFKDTIIAGRGLCDETSVRILVNEGVERTRELIAMGMKFDMVNGELAQGLEGGHSKRRVIHAGGDATGIKIVNFLIDRVSKNKNITVFENTLVYELLSVEESCYGAYAYRFGLNEDITFFAKATIVAAGGASGIFRRTTNPHTSTGDGIALAYNAGAQLCDMEFIQFHPSAFYSDTGYTFLISEAVRGEGAYLYNHKGERFMPSYHENAELAPRDVVAKAIFNEIRKAAKPYVLLKLDHLDAEYIKTRFSHIAEEAKKFEIDITKDPVPISPAAHYMIGGVRSGYEAETNIKRLFVCGEVASTGVHGANRLASNSLLECIVFGKRAADSALNIEKEYVDFSKYAEPRQFKIDDSKEANFTFHKNEIADLMSIGTGIVRTEESLLSTLNRLDEIKKENDYEETEFYTRKLESLLIVASAITRSAHQRVESRGSHIREDFPDENPHWHKRIILQIDNEPKLFSINFNIYNLPNSDEDGNKPDNCR